MKTVYLVNGENEIIETFHSVIEFDSQVIIMKAGKGQTTFHYDSKLRAIDENDYVPSEMEPEPEGENEEELTEI